MKHITPYKELRGGLESIHDHVSSSAPMPPDKVIAYLRAPSPSIACPGVYDHPFIEGRKLLGPYKCTDGNFFWDSDTWKYVLKYNLVLPQDFIDYVMSGAGDAFFEECIEKSELWTDAIKAWKKKQGYIAFLPSRSELIALEKF